MPLPSFGFGHRPSWEYEAPDASGAVLEEPAAAAGPEGMEGQGRGRDRRRHRARPGHRDGVRRSSGCNVAFCFVNMPGRDVVRAGAAHRDGARRHGRRGLRHPLRRARPGRRSSASSARPSSGSAASTSWSTTPASPTTARSGGSATRRGREVLDTNVTGAFNCIRRGRADLPAAALRQDRQRERPPGRSAGLRGRQLRGEQGGAARASPARRPSSSARPTST